jgi:spermidine/putrescine transport system substrate-binding protein
MKKRLSLLFSFFIILSTTLFVGCTVTPKESINFFNYGANIDEETLKLFEKTYNIKVNMGTFDEMEVMYQKISSGSVAYDVILVSDMLLPRMIEEDLLMPLNLSQIPNFSQLDPMYLNLAIDPNNLYSVPYMFGTVGLLYDTNVVKEPVTSWDILWDSRYKDKIFMFDTYRDTIGVALKKLGYSLNSTDTQALEEARILLLQQREQVAPKYGVDNGTTMIETGETAINMIWSGEGLHLQDTYPNLVYVVPQEGANIWLDSLCIPKNATNLSGAEKFINFLTDKTSALRIAEEIGYTTPNKEAQLLQDISVRNNPNAYMDETLLKSCEFYVDLPSDAKKIYDYIWTQIKIGH